MSWLERRRKQREYRQRERDWEKRAEEHRREVEARPEIPHRGGYEFVRCGDSFGQNSGCGWYQDVETDEAAEALSRHSEECPVPLRGLMVPMWSIAWPWYNSPEEQAHRDRLGPGAPWGLEMAWRPFGSHSIQGGMLISTMQKPWYLFPAKPPVLS